MSTDTKDARGTKRKFEDEPTQQLAAAQGLLNAKKANLLEIMDTLNALVEPAVRPANRKVFTATLELTCLTAQMVGIGQSLAVKDLAAVAKFQEDALSKIDTFMQQIEQGNAEVKTATAKVMAERAGLAATEKEVSSAAKAVQGQVVQLVGFLLNGRGSGEPAAKRAKKS